MNILINGIGFTSKSCNKKESMDGWLASELPLSTAVSPLS